MSFPFHLFLKKRLCRAVWLCALMLAWTAEAELRKVRVSDPVLAETLVAQGGRRIADYGSFQMIEADEAQIIGLSPDRVELADDSHVIQLHARPLDTRRPEVRALRKTAGAFPGRRLHLVQFAGPVKPEWLEALKQQGAQVVGHVPNNAFLIYGSAAALARVHSWAQSADCVQWDGEYADDYKLHPRARAVDSKGNPRQPGTDLFAVQLLDDTDANPATLALIDRLKLEPVKRDFRTLHYRNLIVRLPPGQLARLAAQPEVISIQPYAERRKLDERQNQIVAGNLSGGLPSGPGYLAWLAGRGFTQSQFDASGFVVDVSDSGIDNGTNSPAHFALRRLGDPGQSGRVAYNRLEGTPHSGSTLEGCDGHGNLDAHIIAGYVNLTNAYPHADAGGYYYGLGVCPFVKVGSSVVFDPDFFTYPVYADLQSRAYEDGARISANSWGAEIAGVYDVEAQAYDALVRDAQPAGSAFPAAGNQAMVIVFSAGNAGNAGPQTISSPGSAKNVITVGASEGVRSLSTTNGGNNSEGTDGCGESDESADNADDLISFSSRGPCADGRMKPDLVAPGSHITGGVPQAGTPTTNGLGTANYCFMASGVCALPGGGTAGNPNNFFPLGQEFYTVSSGTSHATPAVAGACALLRQHFINNSLPPPSPAMTKAWLMNSARYMAGEGAGDSLWSPGQGMGALDLGTAFNGLPRLLRDQVSADKFTGTGQTRTFIGTISNPAAPFRVTLAWTDAPGLTSGNAFNNDLDLTVIAGGNTYKGNVFSGAASATGGAFDRKNNVESVFLPAGLSGGFLITVTAANINSDGVPNESPALDQDFALVAANAVAMPAPVIVSESYAVTSEDCSPGNGAVDPGETVTVAFALKNLGNAGTSNLVATLLATNGVIAPSGQQVYGAIPTNGGIVTQSFSFTAVGLCGDILHPLFQLQEGTNSLGTVLFSINLGVPSTNAALATNSQSLAVPAFGTAGPASPFPSVISISNLAGSVTRLTVTLTGITHPFPGDLDVLLVGPGGTNVLLMSDCGADNALSGVTLTFDDTASGSLPAAGQIVSGTWRPTNYDNDDGFSAPAPSGPFGQSLSVFNGSDPNGAWSLYVQDDYAQDAGSISGGWRISITTSNTVCCTFPNEPPVLAPIADRAVHAGATLVITNSATDPDFPTNTLAFSLDTNAPAGATIDTNSGVFSWTPGLELAGTTNTITVRVTDNGVPPLSDAKSFTVTVEPPPVIQSISLSSNSVSLIWSAISGQTYRVQYKNDLNATSWTGLVPDVTATGPTAGQVHTNSLEARRFYRVMVLP